MTGGAAFGPSYRSALGDPLLIGDDATDTLQVIDLHGRPPTTISLGIPPEPLTDEDIRRTRKIRLDDQPARLTGAIRQAAEVFYSRAMNPKMRSRYGDLRAEPDGTIWVGTYSTNPAEPVSYRIYDRTGRPIAALVTPPRFAIKDTGTTYLLGVQTDEDGVERVVMYDLTRTR